MEGDCRVNGMNMSTNDSGHSFHWMEQVASILFSIFISIRDGQLFFECLYSFFSSMVNFNIMYLNVTFSVSHNIGKQHTEQDMRR